MSDDTKRKIGDFLENLDTLFTILFMLVGLAVFLFGLYNW
jgi:hypothetical protein